jgi:hypothetical protein
MKRGQFALEFIITYGWAFLILAVTVAAIYAFGWIDVSGIMPEKCDFFGQVECVDYYVEAGAVNEVRVRIVNDFNSDIILIDMNATASYADDLCPLPGGDNIPPVGADWKMGEEYEIILSGCAGERFKSRNRLNAKIHLRFRHPDCGTDVCHHTAIGTLDAKIN